MNRQWSQRRFHQMDIGYETRIRYLEDLVHLLISRTNLAPSPPISSPPLANSFQYSTERGLIPLLSKGAAESLKISASSDWTYCFNPPPRTRSPTANLTSAFLAKLPQSSRDYPHYFQPQKFSISRNRHLFLSNNEPSSVVEPEPNKNNDSNFIPITCSESQHTISSSSPTDLFLNPSSRTTSQLSALKPTTALASVHPLTSASLGSSLPKFPNLSLLSSQPSPPTSTSASSTDNKEEVTPAPNTTQTATSFSQTSSPLLVALAYSPIPTASNRLASLPPPPLTPSDILAPLVLSLPPPCASTLSPAPTRKQLDRTSSGSNSGTLPSLAHLTRSPQATTFKALEPVGIHPPTTATLVLGPTTSASHLQALNPSAEDPGSIQAPPTSSFPQPNLPEAFGQTQIALCNLYEAKPPLSAIPSLPCTTTCLPNLPQVPVHPPSPPRAPAFPPSPPRVDSSDPVHQEDPHPVIASIVEINHSASIKHVSHSCKEDRFVSVYNPTTRTVDHLYSEPRPSNNTISDFDIAEVGGISIVDSIDSVDHRLAPEDTNEKLQWEMECQAYYNDILEQEMLLNRENTQVKKKNKKKKKKKEKASNLTPTADNPVLFYV